MYFEIQKTLNYLFETDVISFIVTWKCQKVQKVDDNR